MDDNFDYNYAKLNGICIITKIINLLIHLGSLFNSAEYENEGNEDENFIFTVIPSLLKIRNPNHSAALSSNIDEAITQSSSRLEDNRRIIRIDVILKAKDR